MHTSILWPVNWISREGHNYYLFCILCILRLLIQHSVTMVRLTKRLVTALLCPFLKLAQSRLHQQCQKPVRIQGNAKLRLQLNETISEINNYVTSFKFVSCRVICPHPFPSPIFVSRQQRTWKKQFSLIQIENIWSKQLLLCWWLLSNGHH